MAEVEPSSMSPSRRASDPKRAASMSDPSRRRLSPRELEVAQLVADGLKVEAIARRLGLSAGTVGTYLRHIAAKLQVRGRDEIAAWVVARRTPGHPEAGLRRGGIDRPA